MKYLIGIFTLILSLQSSATQQVKEEFSVDATKFEIRQYPLKSYLDQSKLKSTINQRVCSANWRGYRGSWSLKNDMLVLNNLVTNVCDRTPIPIEARDLFNKNRYPIVAIWYTGTIVVRVSGRTHFITDNRGSFYAETGRVAYKFYKGKLISTTAIE